MAKDTVVEGKAKEQLTPAQKILNHFSARDGSPLSLSAKEEAELAAEVDGIAQSEALKLDKDYDQSTFEFSKDVFTPVIGAIHTQKFEGNKLKQRSAEKYVKTRAQHWQSFIRGAQRLKKLQEQMDSVAMEQDQSAT